MAAPDPYLQAPAAERFTAANWKEDARNYSPAGSALFGPQGGEAALVGTVDWERTPAALRFFLGYSNITPIYPPDPAPTPPAFISYYLQRTPPAYHPRYPRLVCKSVAAEDYHLEPRGVPASGAYSVKTVETTLPTLQAGIPAAYNNTSRLGTPIGFQTSYDKSRITARFAPVPYIMFTDSEVQIGGAGGEEWRRWTWINQAPKAEILSLTGFQQIYYEGTGFVGGTVSNPAGPPANAYPSDVGTVLVKSDIEIIWEDVPEGWIFGRGSDNMPDNFPRNILRGLGTVNETDFLGYTAGTLLLNGVMLERKPWPLAAGGESFNNYTVRFQCSFFDPDKGYSYIAGVATKLDRPGDTRGHNCFPWKGNFTSGDINAGLWFGASYNGASGGQGLFRKTEFKKLFNTPINPY